VIGLAVSMTPISGASNCLRSRKTSQPNATRGLSRIVVIGESTKIVEVREMRDLPTEKAMIKVTGAIPWAKPDLAGNEQKYVSEAVASTWISDGPFVERFEREFSGYCGSRYAMTASNGTTALHMAFLALGVGPGDEVILPGFAFMAAANVALHLGAKPVFTEVDPLTWCMNANEVEKHISSKTKVIVPVHTYGNMCAMSEIMELANSKSIPVVEDAAEAFASRHNNRHAGTIGAMGTFSFHATKTITTGEGGMVVTQSQQFFDRMYLFRNHGMLRTRYWHELHGHNFRLTNIQAGLGCAQLERIDRIIAERKRIYASYQRYLSNASGITMQFFAADVEPVVWSVALKLDARAYPQGRNEVMRQLQETQIETRNGFYAASLLQHLYACPKLSICEDLSEQVISLPTYCALEDCDIHYICSTLESLRK
jgi:perosamine synthetase